MAKRANQSILKELNPEYSLEGLMLKLKRQYFGHLIRRVNSLEKTLMLGKIEGKSRGGRQRMRWLDSITISMDTNLSQLLETVEDRGTWHAASMGSQRVGHNSATNIHLFIPAISPVPEVPAPRLNYRTPVAFLDLKGFLPGRLQGQGKGSVRPDCF